MAEIVASVFCSSIDILRKSSILDLISLMYFTVDVEKSGLQVKVIYDNIAIANNHFANISKQVLAGCFQRNIFYHLKIIRSYTALLEKDLETGFIMQMLGWLLMS